MARRLECSVLAFQLCLCSSMCVFLVYFTSLSFRLTGRSAPNGCTSDLREPWSTPTPAPQVVTPAVTFEKASSQRDDGYFAMCLIVKDQGMDILEWVEYHRGLGASKFYIFDHNSSVPMIRELHPLVKSGLVEYEYIQEFTAQSVWVQAYVYDLCMQEIGPRHGHSWMALIDADEFLALKDDHATTMPALLREYEAYGGLGVNWRVFGSSGLIARPSEGTVASFTSCIPEAHDESTHIKTIVHIPFGIKLGRDPHHVEYVPGKFAVNELFDRVDGPRTTRASYTRIALNHYAVKSYEEFALKAVRGAAHGVRTKTLEYFKYVEALATDSCTEEVGLGRQVMTRLQTLAHPSGLIPQPSPEPEQPPPTLDPEETLPQESATSASLSQESATSASLFQESATSAGLSQENAMSASLSQESTTSASLSQESATSASLSEESPTSVATESGSNVRPADAGTGSTESSSSTEGTVSTAGSSSTEGTVVPLESQGEVAQAVDVALSNAPVTHGNASADDVTERGAHILAAVRAKMAEVHMPVLSGGLPVQDTPELSGGLPVQDTGLESAGLPVQDTGLESAGLPVEETGSESDGVPVEETGMDSGGLPVEDMAVQAQQSGMEAEVEAEVAARVAAAMEAALLMSGDEGLGGGRELGPGDSAVVE